MLKLLIISYVFGILALMCKSTRRRWLRVYFMSLKCWALKWLKLSKIHFRNARKSAILETSLGSENVAFLYIYYVYNIKLFREHWHHNVVVKDCLQWLPKLFLEASYVHNICSLKDVNKVTSSSQVFVKISL